MHEKEKQENTPPTVEEAAGALVPWQKNGPSPNPKGRPKQPKTVKEVCELARQHTVQMVEVLAKVANNPKSPPAARQAAASSLLDRAWGKPSGDFEGLGEGLTIQIVRFNTPQVEDQNIKTIEHDDGES
jgi:hypothetical protein